MWNGRGAGAYSARAGLQYWLAWPELRASEWILASYFVYIAIRAELYGYQAGNPTFIASMMLAVILAAASAGTTYGGLLWNVVRDWLPAPLILVSYRIVDCFARPFPVKVMETRLLEWDHQILQTWGLRAAIEYFGSAVPILLEASYCLLYAVPPLAIGYLYWIRRRDLVDKFLFTFLLGTLLAYAMLPIFPTQSPRLAAPQGDLAPMGNWARQLNLAILDNCDIQTSVFPSGHVAVGFSSAFAMLLALRKKPQAGLVLLFLALLVWVNTIYGRYHYAADGMVSLLLSICAAAASLLLFRLGVCREVR